MQKVKIKEVRGPLGKGEKKFYAVVGDDGSEFTSFDTKLTQLTEGTVINLEPEVKGKFINIKKWEIVEEAPAAHRAGESQVQGNPARLEFDARATALTVAATLVGTGKIDIADLVPRAEAYRVWLLGGTVSKSSRQAPTSKPTTTAEEDWDNMKRDDEPGPEDTSIKRNPNDLHSIDDLIKACHDDFKLQPGQVYSELNVSSYRELQNKRGTPAEHYAIIASARGK